MVTDFSEELSIKLNGRYLVVFDGVCNLCNGAMRFIIKRDKNVRFVFTPIQSNLGQDVLEHFEISEGPETFVLVKGGEAWVMSSAALEISRDLSGLWFLLRAFKLLPIRLRDRLYSLVARNRYRWFGRRDYCMVPDANLQSRFLD